MLKQILARLDHSTETFPVLAFVMALDKCRKAVTASSDGIDKQLIRATPYLNGMEIRDEIWSMAFMAASPDQNPAVKMRTVYSVNGGFIGEESWAKRLVNYGIVPELKRPDMTVCSVGFSKRRNSWWGWSHRAMAEFTLGDRIFQADYGDDSTPFTQHGPQVINTLEQAREAACNFADYIS